MSVGDVDPPGRWVALTGLSVAGLVGWVVKGITAWRGGGDHAPAPLDRVRADLGATVRQAATGAAVLLLAPTVGYRCGLATRREAQVTAVTAASWLAGRIAPAGLWDDGPVSVDPEQHLVRSQQLEDEARREAAAFVRAAQEPAQQLEWIRQNNVIYGGLIAVGLILVQPFLTSAPVGWSAKTCVIAFAVAIPLLAALILVNRQETFRGRVTSSFLVRASQSVAQLAGFVGVVTGFWHIMWLAGVVTLASGLLAMGVHSAGYFRLEQAVRAGEDAAVR